jgi:YidC/Oxa1 family membrane protein insertase
MGKSNRLAFLYLIIGVLFLFGWQFVQNKIWPPPPKVEKVTDTDWLALSGGGPPWVANEVGAPRLAQEEREEEARKLQAKIDEERKKNPVKPATPSELFAMGHGEKPFHLQVLLNNRGGSVQQVVLSDFQQADREGLPVWDEVDGKKVKHPLHLIPGVRVPHTLKIREQREVKIPELKPGPVTLADSELEGQSYVMYHYEKESDTAPVDTLGNRIWRVARKELTNEGNTQVVAFETELGAPFYVRITKTFTLNRLDYHIGLSVTLTPMDRPAGSRPEAFRYQISGPRGLPIEGEWYTSTYRTGIVGWPGTRTLEDARNVRNLSGSDPYRSAEKKPIRYTGVMVQYFASVLAVDNEQPEGQARDYIDYVRFTPEGPTHKNEEKKLDQTFLDDFTFRAVSKPTDSSVATTHPYVLYHGPVKVRLLKQLEGEKEVPTETVHRYRDDLGLNTMTDAPMPNWIGTFASTIFWTDIVITFTNLVHSLLFYLSQIVPNLGLCIMIITIMVRGLLHPFSRRQMINAKKMQAKQAKLAPEMKKLQEKYGDDMTRMNQEKMKLYREHGINPAAAMGGCVLLLMQMPIFMGLYYALQESVFFRLESFLWIKNLAAPDMLVWWGEGIPYISAPESLGGTIYLGPYLNLLPLISVSLMMYVQTKMMPKSDDPQVQMQQKTMKIMMVIMLFFFYKVAAGLCIYFICSSIWGMIERRLIPKNIGVEDESPAVGPGFKDREKPKPAEPKGWLGKKMAGWREKWDKILEDAQKQQQIQHEQRPQGPGKRKKKGR